MEIAYIEPYPFPIRQIQKLFLKENFLFKLSKTRFFTEFPTLFGFSLIIKTIFLQNVKYIVFIYIDHICVSNLG